MNSQNTKLSYFYRDAGNYKNFGEVVFDNSDGIPIEEVEKLLYSKLIDGVYFYASQWQLPDLHFSQWDNELDHGFHELERLVYTVEPATDKYTLKQFLVIIDS